MIHQRIPWVILSSACLASCAAAPPPPMGKDADPGRCQLRWVDGQPLPDPDCTPGALDPGVSSATLGATICRTGGYTSSVRPPAEKSAALKRQVMIAYGLADRNSEDFEADHLVPLSLGGDPSDVRNLWPQPNVFVHFLPGQYARNDKDAVETWAHRAVCSGRLPLAEAQHAMATNWISLIGRVS